MGQRVSVCRASMQEDVYREASEALTVLDAIGASAAWGAVMQRLNAQSP